jgi:iron(III) transport system substrate-binding protein
MKKYLVSIVLTAVFAVIAAVQSYASEVVVYSARKDHLIRPLFEAYKKETGGTAYAEIEI